MIQKVNPHRHTNIEYWCAYYMASIFGLLDHVYISSSTTIRCVPVLGERA